MALVEQREISGIMFCTKLIITSFVALSFKHGIHVGHILRNTGTTKHRMDQRIRPILNFAFTSAGSYFACFHCRDVQTSAAGQKSQQGP